MGRNKKCRKYKCTMLGSDAPIMIKVGADVSMLVLTDVDELKGDASPSEREWYLDELCQRVKIPM